MKRSKVSSLLLLGVYILSVIFGILAPTLQNFQNDPGTLVKPRSAFADPKLPNCEQKTTQGRKNCEIIKDEVGPNVDTLCPVGNDAKKTICITEGMAKIQEKCQEFAGNESKFRSCVKDEIKPEDPAPTDDEEDTCATSAVTLGWLFCPIIELAQNAIKLFVNNIILPVLNVEPLTSNSDIYKLWDQLRLLANVLFALIFFVIIFANTLSINVDNYTVKKMLPRLVAAAILVQFSFLISSIAVDFGNVLGNGVADLINFTIGGANTNSPGDNTGAFGVGKDAAGYLITGIGGLALLTTIGVFGLISMIITAFFSVLGVVLTLVARQLLINVLVVVSPIAFAAWVLPGTERMFKTWYQTLIKLILMFPMIVILLSVGSLLSAASVGNKSGLQLLLASLFPIISFLLIPLTFRFAGGFMGRAAGFIAGRSTAGGKMAGGKIRDSKAKKAYDDRRQWADQERMERWASKGGLRNLPGRYISGLRTRGDVLAGHGPRKDLLRRQRAAQSKDAYREAGKVLENMSHGDIETIAHSGTDPVRVAAATGILNKRGVFDSQSIENIKRMKKSGVQNADQILDYARQENFGDLVKRSPGLALAGLDSFDFTQKDAEGKSVPRIIASEKDAEALVGKLKSTAPGDLPEIDLKGAKLLVNSELDGIRATDHITVDVKERAGKSRPIISRFKPGVADALDVHENIPDDKAGNP